MLDVKITCPLCSKRGNIQVEENIIKNSNRGITAVNVGEFLICPHSFIVYIDTNFTVRDSLVSDFKVEIPDIKFNKKESPKKKKTFDTDIIKINFFPSQLILVLKCAFLKKKVAIIYDEEYIAKLINEFIEYLFEDDFTFDISLISNKSYKNNKKTYRNHVIIQGNEIIKGKDKLFDSKKLKIESMIAQKFYHEFDPEYSLILIKNEIKKANLLAIDLINYIKKKQKIKIEITDIIEEIKSIHNVKVKSIYIYFLIDLVKNYHEMDVPLIEKNIMGFL